MSGLNACNYCYGAHSAIAKAFGIDIELIEAMQTDLHSADISEKLRPIIDYVSKLTVTPGRMTSSDAQAVYAAGWDEKALYDAILVCALFNFMNRLVEGTGRSPETKASEEDSDDPFESYVAWGREVGFID